MLLILLIVSCLAGQPKSCSVSAMKAFDVSDSGIRAACNELLKDPETTTSKKALTIMYADGLKLQMSNASAACMTTPEKTNPVEYRKAFLENVWSK